MLRRPEQPRLRVALALLVAAAGCLWVVLLPSTSNSSLVRAEPSAEARECFTRGGNSVKVRANRRAISPGGFTWLKATVRREVECVGAAEICVRAKRPLKTSGCTRYFVEKKVSKQVVGVWVQAPAKTRPGRHWVWVRLGREGTPLASDRLKIRVRR